jgi:uncharacterized membrane protein
MAVRLRLSQNWARRGGAAVPFLSVGGSDADTSLKISVQTAPGTLFQGAGDPSLGCQSALPKYPLSPTSSSCSRAPMPPTPPDDSNAQSRPTERPTQPPSTAGRAPLKSQQHAQDRAPDRANHDPIECLLSDPSGEPTRVVVNPNSRARPKANPISSSSSNSSASPATSPIHPPPAPAAPAASAPPTAAPSSAHSPQQVSIEEPSATPGPPLAEKALPCTTCGYDLRGRPGGARCPECGATVPLRSRPASGSFSSTDHRDALFNCWYGLSTSCVFLSLLVSPLAFIVPLGVGVAVCIGFAPAFRLAALRGLDALPAAILGPTRARLVLLRQLERTQLALAVLITIGAALATVGALGSWAVPLYQIALAMWWLLALAALRVQVLFGDELSRHLVEEDTLPLEIPPRISKAILATFAFGVVATAALIAAIVVYRGSAPATGTGTAFTVAIACCAPVVGFLAHFACAWASRAQAVLVANCAYESRMLRVDPNRRTREQAIDPAAAVASSASASPRHSFTPRDDASIKLPER